MSQISPSIFMVVSCVNPIGLGWIHATGGFEQGRDKAGFHAMIAI